MSRARRGALGAALVAAVMLTAAPPALGTGPGSNLGRVVIANVGYGYAVTSQGPLQAGALAASSPDPGGVARAVRTLGRTVATYQRVWQDAGRHNDVQDLVLRFSTQGAAGAFLQATRRSLDSAEIVTSGPLPQVAGADRTTYFASTDQVGTGQAITLRDGDYVMVLSTFSAGSANAQPISTGDAVSLARAQQAALTRAGAAPAAARGGDATGPILGWCALALVAATASVVWVRRGRRRNPTSPAWRSGPAGP